MRHTLKSLYINDVEDYFRRLGGQGCYSGYQDWHSSALIICLLLDLNIALNIHPSMINETNRLPILVKEKLDHMQIDTNQLDEFMLYVKDYLRRNRGNDLAKFENFINENRFIYDDFIKNLR